MKSSACAKACTAEKPRLFKATLPRSGPPINPAMTEHLPENLQTKITERLAFYQDLGINLFYRDRTAGSLQPSLARSTGSPLAREGEPLPKLTPNSEKRE